MIEYLKEKYELKYYLCELPHSVAIKMNEFFESGNKDILEEFYRGSAGTNTYTEESYQRWVELYELNQTLSKDDKITMVGVECELIPEYAMGVICELLPDKEAPAEIAPMVEQIKKNVCTPEEIADMLSTIEENETICENYFGDKMFDIKHMLKNIEIGYHVHEKDTNHDKYMIRDQAMYDNFVVLNSRNKQGKYFGQFGYLHALQSEEQGVKWFASLLKENGYDGKIASIMVEYKNCHRIYFNDYNTPCIDTMDTGPMADISQEVIGNLSKDNAVIYSAVEEKSPYHHLTDYIQYVIIVKDSEQAVPLEM